MFLGVFRLLVFPKVRRFSFHIVAEPKFGDYDIFNKHWQLTFVTFRSFATSEVFNRCPDRQHKRSGL